MTDHKKSIIKYLSILERADTFRRKPFQARAYSEAIDQLKSIQGPVTTLQDVEGLSGFGKKLKEKVEEIITTGKLKAAEEASKELKLDLIDELLGIHGVGPVKAQELITSGVTSIADLRQKLAADPSILNDVQTLGLKHYEDSQLRIPRAEMAKHEEFIINALHEEFQGVVVGSYRRGAENSGDIDVLLTLPDRMSAKNQGALFTEIVDLLRGEKYIVDTLAQGPKKFLGYVKLKGKNKHVRRLDLLMLPESEYAYAILYFTGSKNFNKAFRAYALQKGYTLNEHRLEPIKEGVPAVPKMKTEQDIFDFLGLQYVEPTMRRGESDVQPL